VKTRGLALALVLAGCHGGDPAKAPEKAPASTASAPERAPAAPARVRFGDATAAAQIRFTHMSGRSGRRYYVEPHSGGCAAFDADGDGRTDLYAVDGGPLPGYTGAQKRSNRLFRNRGDGTFEDVTDRAGVAGRDYGFGAFPADFDGDGDEDLFVTNFGKNLLYRNRGDGTFEDVTAAAGLGLPAGWSTGAAWFDADGDGDLDLYVVHYVQYDLEHNVECWRGGVKNYCAPADFQAEQDRFYRNRGDGTFEDATDAFGIAPGNGKGLGALVHDLDADGKPDVYVANDETPKLLYHGLGGGKFEEIGLRTGLAVNMNGAVQAGMGIDAGDLDGDGRPDVVVSNFQDEGINDFRQQQPMLFTDRALSTGLGPESTRSLGFGVLLFDVDLDGDLDVFVANGHVWDNIADTQPLVTYKQRNLLGINDGRGQLTESSREAGDAFARPDVTRGACLIDFDADGDQDLFLIHLDGDAQLLRNETAHGHWLGLVLEGKGMNREALGARLRVTAGGRTQTLQNWRVRGYLSTSERALHVGLGAAERVEKVEIAWPDGGTTSLADLAADALYTVDEATGKATPRR
jgi:hypothetical protein